MQLHGIFPPLTTPFAPGGSLALHRLRSNIERYNQTRLSGYVILGSTGEAILLSCEEGDRVLSAAHEVAAPGKILIAGTGVDSTAETIERTRRAAEFGYRAALVRTPHYYKPQMTPETLADYYLRVADASPIPVLVYSVPQFTGVNVEAPLVARLATHANIVGIKESSGEVRRAAEIVKGVPPGFQTLVGSASTLYASLQAGAVGGILAAACIFPELCVDLYEAARTGDSKRAESLQKTLQPPSSVLVSRLGVPGVKFALDCLGYYGGPARPPLQPLTDGQKREVEEVLAGVAAATAVRV